MIVTGDIIFDEFKTVFRAAWEDRTYLDARFGVWDLSQCRSRLNPGDVQALKNVPRGPEKNRRAAALALTAARELAEFTRANRPDRLPRRVAVIAANDLDLGTMRVYAGFTGNDGELQIFRTLPTAKAWLFESAADD